MTGCDLFFIKVTIPFQTPVSVLRHTMSVVMKMKLIIRQKTKKQRIEFIHPKLLSLWVFGQAIFASLDLNHFPGTLTYMSVRLPSKDERSCRALQPSISVYCRGCDMSFAQFFGFTHCRCSPLLWPCITFSGRPYVEDHQTVAFKSNGTLQLFPSFVPSQFKSHLDLFLIFCFRFLLWSFHHTSSQPYNTGWQPICLSPSTSLGPKLHIISLFSLRRTTLLR